MHYILSQKEERGCPMGYLRAVLYDKYYTRKEAERVELGNFPWYASIHDPDIKITLPEGMVCIAKYRLWDFDIRANGFFIVSDEFMGLLTKFSVALESFAPITVCSQEGKSIARKKYHAVIFPKLDIFDVLDQEKSDFKIDAEFGFVSRIRHLAIKPGFSQHLFVPTLRLDPRYRTPLCSEIFHEAAIDLDIKGVSFMPLHNINWSLVHGIY